MPAGKSAQEESRIVLSQTLSRMEKEGEPNLLQKKFVFAAACQLLLHRQVVEPVQDGDENPHSYNFDPPS